MRAGGKRSITKKTITEKNCIFESYGFHVFRISEFLDFSFLLDFQRYPGNEKSYRRPSSVQMTRYSRIL